MPNVKLTLPPGMLRNGTDDQAAGRWNDGNLVRFTEGTIRPWLGWRTLLRANLYVDSDYLATETDYVVMASPPLPVTGAVRAARAWRTNAGVAVCAFGSKENLYVYANGVIHDITPAGIVGGGADTVASTGAYGAGAYGLGPYGSGDPLTQTYTPAAVWRLDTFGEQLVGVLAPSDGKLYAWDAVLADVAAVVANAPTGLVGCVVSEERFLIALGSGGNPRRVDWASQETLTTWGALPTNTAGGFDLATTGSLVCGRRVRGGVLLLTDNDAHLMEYVGPPFIYGRRRIGTGGVVGPEAVAVLANGAVWMGRNGFYLYDGAVDKVPCEVTDAVFGDFNTRQGVKVAAWHNAELGKVVWFYPSSASLDNDRYVEWDYKENHWSTGMLGRSAAVGRGPFDTPFLFAVDGTAYEHEVGFDYGSLTTFIESGPFVLGAGDTVLACRKLYPDALTAGDARATFFVRDHATSAETAKGPYSLAAQTDIRFTARRVRLRLDGAVFDDWRVGSPIVEAVPAGRR